MSKYVLIPVIVVLVAMVVISLVRGIIAFFQSARAEVDHAGGADMGPTPGQLKQNRLMFARIKYQALAVAVLALLLAVTRH